MNGTRRLSQRFVYWSAILTGVVFVYWGGGAALLPDRLLAPATVSWGTQLLATISQYIWLPAVGALLIVLGLFPALARHVRGNRVLQLVVGLVGLGVIVGGGMGLGISVSTPGELLYLSPLFVAGGLLVGLVLPG